MFTTSVSVFALQEVNRLFSHPEMIVDDEMILDMIVANSPPFVATYREGIDPIHMMLHGRVSNEYIVQFNQGMKHVVGQPLFVQCVIKRQQRRENKCVDKDECQDEDECVNTCEDDEEPEFCHIIYCEANNEIWLNYQRLAKDEMREGSRQKFQKLVCDAFAEKGIVWKSSF